MGEPKDEQTRDVLFRFETQTPVMPAYEAVCQTCDWRKPLPQRDMAEHAKRVHEEEYGHTVFIEQPRQPTG